VDHEVLDFPRMIAKLEGMNLNQENPKTDPEKEEPQQESEKVLIQMKETLNDHRHVRLSEIFKEKECIEARIGDLDIDCILDEETQMNIMPEENLGSYRKAFYDPFARRNRFTQRKIGKIMWKAHLDTHDCQWNFDRGGL
jgi:hypothetical protein